MRIMMARIRDGILDEAKIKLAAEKNGKLFIGPLWFPPTDEKLEEIFSEVTIADDATDIQIANEAYKLEERFCKLASDGSSWSCSAHWAGVNGLADKRLLTYGKDEMDELEKRRAKIQKEINSILRDMGEITEKIIANENLTQAEMDLHKQYSDELKKLEAERKEIKDKIYAYLNR